ncbi:ribonuclease III [Herbaspirillum sp. meg3]|uniref:ribonuclease III n=1 Tax=Herbaspirillum sp. meg3 TaxID=2025949 RepID=UPI000B988A18|nr:ribonuclease III [Herbaspirillum sp. meg3]ASU39755.1 ribonuclease III [Herbaspirillum sp. meg3]
MDPLVLQNRLGHTFKDATLLQQALTHRSHSSLHNERLEFLGDSILNCVVASLLFDRYSKIDEGDLSRLRANLVKQQSLYEIAQRLDLSQFLRLGEGELKSGGFRRPSILADTLEALFGAIFLDAGFNAARDVIRSLYIPILDTVDPKTLGKDAKTLLQEYLQGKKIPLPQYNVVATHGAAHNQEFEIECLVPKLEIQVFGTGGSRRAGEQAAAKLALEAVQAALVKAPASARKPRTRTTQLKLAGIATIQPDAPNEELPLLAEPAAPKVENKVEKPVSIKTAKSDAAKGDAKADGKADGKADNKADSKAETKSDKLDAKNDRGDSRGDNKAQLAAADLNENRSEAVASAPPVTQSKTA